MTDERRIPPSFTPTGGHSSRPQQTGDAISVGGSASGGPRAGGRVGRRDDAVPLESREPRVRRQSSREIPVTPKAPQRRSAAPARQPQSYAPAVGSSRPRVSRAAQPPAAQPPAGASGTRVMPTGTRQASPAARPAPARGDGGGPTGRGPTRPDQKGPGGFRVRKGRVAGLAFLLVLVLLLAWPIGLIVWANGQIQHTDALSDAEGTPGTTYLLAGSDARGSGGVNDSTSGARTDTIMVLHKPRSGPTALISIPRDTYVEIPGEGMNKVNAAYAWGGAPLLVQTVEGLTGLTMDHYAEVGFGSLEEIVDAVGGVELCLDYDVDDPKSELVWEAGCHQADGATALAFSRMRYSDPKGDIGRAERQQQVIAGIADTAVQPSVLLNPIDQVQLVGAGTDALVVDQKTGLIDLGRLALAFKGATGPEGVTGTPPIADPGYNPGNGVGSTVLLTEDVDTFWADLRDGNLEPGSTVGGL
ncbi:LCP family protein [Isoptericola sp. S6320L]|uniref:LCP family protein n=1 Tax=Isoptericola sp. S6320L TaxID=2926411 RepID=UPI001FF39F45|nr:LCP family protein [Isoptericola sp. S6320L]MCK0117814.1 LCP family protein [Isoptericola sp. S6320L]